LYREHLERATALISRGLAPEGDTGTRRRCYLVSAKGDDKACTDSHFSWPVVPGIRFLLPWLKLVRELPDELTAGEYTLAPVELKAILFEAGVTTENLDPEASDLWGLWKRYSGKDEKCCGLILHVGNLRSAGDFCRLITRRLIAHNRRMGGTSHLFHDVLTGDLTRVEGLSTAAQFYSRSLEPDILFDMEHVQDSSMLITFSWGPPSSEALDEA
jgi:hypothetical protein